LSHAVHLLVPGALATRTGGFIYDRRMVDALRASGWQVTVHELGAGFPAPSAEVLQQAARTIAALPDGALVVADGLAFGVLPDMAQAHARRLRWVALVHHPLALESGLSAARQQALRASERRALACTQGVIVTSPATARDLAGDGVPAARIAVAEPGTDAAPLARGSSGSGDAEPLSLLCVASLTPRKNHLLLLEALAGLRSRGWTLHCVGSAAMDPACAAAAAQAVTRLGLQQRVLLHGELAGDALAARYAQADAFVLPSLHEGYGMALAEALARGLPVISTRAGAIPDTVPADAGALVPPGDVVALRAALQRLMDDAPWRAKCAAGARAARLRLPTWEDSAARFAEALLRFSNGAAARA